MPNLKIKYEKNSEIHALSVGEQEKAKRKNRFIFKHKST
ncbi:hypothetical protein T190611E02C_60056 [Tenacibaculum sp. 190524A05c]